MEKYNHTTGTTRGFPIEAILGLVSIHTMRAFPRHLMLPYDSATWPSSFIIYTNHKPALLPYLLLM